MGRRALRKIDPSLDLSRWLKSADDLLSPWDSEALFGRGAPLEVELGSGKGLFLVSAAQAHPQVNYLGIELARKYAQHAAARLARRKIAHALVVHGDGLQIFRELLPDASLAAVHVYFPDPWWKARHKKRRVMNAAFVRDVQRTLVPGGSLHFWTDVEEYFQSSLGLIAEETTLLGPFDVAQLAAEHDLDYRTHFERRTRQSGQRVFRSEFRRKGPAC